MESAWCRQTHPLAVPGPVGVDAEEEGSTLYREGRLDRARLAVGAVVVVVADLRVRVRVLDRRADVAVTVALDLQIAVAVVVVDIVDLALRHEHKHKHGHKRQNNYQHERKRETREPRETRASRLAPRASRLAPRASRLAPRASRLAPGAWRLAPRQCQRTGPLLHTLADATPALARARAGAAMAHSNVKALRSTPSFALPPSSTLSSSHLPSHSSSL